MTGMTDDHYPVKNGLSFPTLKQNAWRLYIGSCHFTTTERNNQKMAKTHTFRKSGGMQRDADAKLHIVTSWE